MIPGFLSPGANQNSAVIAAVLPSPYEFVYSDSVPGETPEVVTSRIYGAATVELLNSVGSFAVRVRLNHLHDVVLVDRIE